MSAGNRQTGEPAREAQQAERSTCNREGAGSSPATGFNENRSLNPNEKETSDESSTV